MAEPTEHPEDPDPIDPEIDLGVAIEKPGTMHHLADGGARRYLDPQHRLIPASAVGDLNPHRVDLGIRSFHKP